MFQIFTVAYVCLYEQFDADVIEVIAKQYCLLEPLGLQGTKKAVNW